MRKCILYQAIKRSPIRNLLPGFMERLSKKENICEIALTIEHPQKLLNTLNEKHLKKLIVTSLLIDIAPSMAKPMVKFLIKTSIKQKQDRLKSTNKCTKKS